LPSDELSIQNAIMVTRSSRYPLMVDPQGQANRWIKSREKARISENPSMCITTLSAKNLKDQIEFTMGEGLCLIIENVENEVDPMLDPVLDTTSAIRTWITRKTSVSTLRRACRILTSAQSCQPKLP